MNLNIDISPTAIADAMQSADYLAAKDDLTNDSPATKVATEKQNLPSQVEI